MQKKTKFKGLWLTDFDGTIKPKPGPVAPADLAALQGLGQEGWFRVVATGRSLFNFCIDWGPNLELDALIFASGAGMCFWSTLGPSPLVRSFAFTETEAQATIGAALELGWGFYAYQALPDNHHFYYHQSAHPSPGFLQRVQEHHHHCRPWPVDFFTKNPQKVLSQVLIMVPVSEARETEARFHQLAPGMSLIHSSSPYPDQYRWLEIFPPGVSKATAAAKLADDLGLTPAEAVALGNDYNDRDLLEWAGHSFITSDAPPDMRTRHQNILPAGQGGLALAAEVVSSRLQHRKQ